MKLKVRCINSFGESIIREIKVKKVFSHKGEKWFLHKIVYAEYLPKIRYSKYYQVTHVKTGYRVCNQSKFGSIKSPRKAIKRAKELIDSIKEESYNHQIKKHLIEEGVLNNL